MSAKKDHKKFYITTPIYYVNDRPHIGHAYTTVIADAYARFYRELLGGENVFFLTGTDEHGTKVANSAEKKGLRPQVFADQVVVEYKKVWESLGISYDHFFRTTDPQHIRVVQDFLVNLYNKGFIYKGVYKGVYCVGCEKFLSFEEIVNGACIQHPNLKLEEKEEENYFFKLGDFSKQVLTKLEAGEYGVLPVERRNEIIGKIRQGVNDVSVSRPGVSWGIPLPWDEKHTVYVWVDALINYFSATKIVPNKAQFWPPTLHIVGKDILWFHALVWIGLLLAHDLDIPHEVFAHGFFTVDGQKMSKSLGNVINPLDMVAEYGVDATRYLLISAFTFGTDGDISLTRFREKYNADLANGIGNLVARVSKLAEKLSANPVDERARARIRGQKFPDIEVFFAEHKPEQALRYIIDRAQKLDQKIAEEEPWTRDDGELEALLKVYIEELLAIGVNIQPFLPDTAEKMVQIFSAEKIVKPSEALFARK